MAPRRAPTQAEKRKRRLRAAELREQRAKEEKARSRRINRALKKAAKRDEENRQIRKENRALRKRVENLEKQLKKAVFDKEYAEAWTGKRKLEDVSFEPGELEAGKQAIKELYFREMTPEERLLAMRERWREIENLVSTLSLPRSIQIQMWLQRNGFEPTEFWAEYRRRR